MAVKEPTINVVDEVCDHPLDQVVQLVGFQWLIRLGMCITMYIYVRTYVRLRRRDRGATRWRPRDQSSN